LRNHVSNSKISIEKDFINQEDLNKACPKGLLVAIILIILIKKAWKDERVLSRWGLNQRHIMLCLTSLAVAVVSLRCKEIQIYFQLRVQYWNHWGIQHLHMVASGFLSLLKLWTHSYYLDTKTRPSKKLVVNR
jgi:hypothetical protein